MPPIDFYFDFASPYGYFMSEKIEAMAREHGRTVVWQPVMLFAVLRALEMPAPLGHPVKLEYTMADFARSAKFLGVDYQLPPSFPAITPHAARAFYMLQKADPEGAVGYAHAALRAHFRDGQNISGVDFIAGLVCENSTALGPADEARALIESDEAKKLLKDAIDTAVGKKVFGSPFIFIDGEPFFGVDRLPQIAAKLAGSLSPRLVSEH